MRHNWPDTSSPVSIDSFAEVIDDTRELHQICDGDECSLVADNQLGIRRDLIGPLRRNGADRLAPDLEEEAPAITVAPLAYTNKLLAAQRVKRMQDTHKTRGRDRSVCTLE
jgi:hypothetical protein